MFKKDLFETHLRFDKYTKQHANEYQQENPFPHIILEDFLPGRVINKISEEFPHADDGIWESRNRLGIEVKKRSNWTSFFDIPETTHMLLTYLNSGLFLKSLSNLTGINKLISDPYYTGGGYNYIERGGHLALHCDGNWHDDMAVHRRLNVILFLNKTWQEDWKGELEFWDKNLQNCSKMISPKFNRLVIFTTNDYTFHGVPNALKCPVGQGRKSLIQYYYTSRPREESEVKVSGPHRALWQRKVEYNKDQAKNDEY